MLDLETHIANDLSVPVSQTVTALAQHIRYNADNRDSVAAILLYGSGLWQGDAEDRIWDVHVLVHRYKGFRKRLFLSVMGSFLPPNVFYTEFEYQGRTLRCKYNVMRVSQFEKACRGKSFTPQVWARFAQPCRLVYAESEAMTDRIARNITNAVDRFFKMAAPFSGDEESARSFWVNGLQQTYADEMRSESEGRAAEIFAAHEQAATLRFDMWRAEKEMHGGEGKFRRRALRPLRKLVALLRILKSSVTFENGVDYALWKVKRHSGVEVEVSAFQRRHPLIAGWPVLWKLYRKGAFK